MGQVANHDAVPLFFLLLQEADAADAAWGLAVWYRLVATSLVNAHACHRAGLFPLLLQWLEGAPAAAAAVEDGESPRGPAETAPTQPPDPRLQVRLALLLQARPEFRVHLCALLQAMALCPTPRVATGARAACHERRKLPPPLSAHAAHSARGRAQRRRRRG